MINANELRLGNWVLHDGKPMRVKILMPGKTSYLPIPLTPEILEKAGFTLFPWGWVKNASNDFGVRLNVKSFSYDVSGNSPVKIEHVHQLQNLYFALTGEELEINLP